MEELNKPGSVNKKKRSFLNLFLGFTAFLYFGAFFNGLIKYLVPNRKTIKKFFPVNLGAAESIEKNPRFSKKNSSLIFSFNGDPAILVKTKEGYKAFSAICTHLGCVVEYKKQKDVFYCNCHGGVYSSTGDNISGPPPSPLEAYDIKKEGGNLIVRKKSNTILNENSKL